MPEATEADIGKLTRYYREGWRVGTLEEINGATVRIIPIGGRHKDKPRRVKVALSDTETLEKQI